MDNLGRDMERMMWVLVGAGVLMGAGAAGAIIWVIRRFGGG